MLRKGKLDGKSNHSLSHNGNQNYLVNSSKCSNVNKKEVIKSVSPPKKDKFQKPTNTLLGIFSRIILISFFCVGLISAVYIFTLPSKVHVKEIIASSQDYDYLYNDYISDIFTGNIDNIGNRFKVNENIIRLSQLNLSNGAPAHDENRVGAEILRDYFLKCNLDYVSPLLKEDVFVSMKNSSVPDMITIVSYNNTTKRAASIIESLTFNPVTKYVLPDEASTKKVVSTESEGSPIYMNYGRHEDYEYVEFYEVSVKNRIIIARLGKISLFDKIQIAFSRGATGLLLFADPKDYEDTDISTVYHDIPPVVLGKLQQRFGVLYDGRMYRGYRSVPVQIIPAIIAKYLLSKMADKIVTPVEWAGEMDVGYPIGPNFQETDWRIVMRTTVYNILFANYDIVGTIKGVEEPDRYVIVGSHRQPTTESLDGLTSSTVFMEIVTALSELKRHSESVPKRSILFISWGLEGIDYYDPSLWMREHKQMLSERAVAYLHIKNPVQGTRHLRVESTPAFAGIIRDIALSMSHPTNNNTEGAINEKQSIYDVWRNFDPEPFPTNDEHHLPRIHPVEDYWLFTFGIPSVTFSYEGDKVLDFKDCKTPEEKKRAILNHEEVITYMWVSLVYRLAESPLLPFQFDHYAVYFRTSAEQIRKHFASEIKGNITDEFDKLNSVVTSFMEHMTHFDDEIRALTQSTDYDDELSIRMVNDRIMQINRLLLCTDHRYNKPILLSESVFQGVGFGHLQDTLVSERFITTPEVIKDAIKNVTLCLNQAIKAIDPLMNFLA